MSMPTLRRPVVGVSPASAILTLAWADARERQRVIQLASSEGRQTMNLRTMPGARLAVLRRPQGGFAGWAGMDADSDPARPEVFSQFVYPAYRGIGLGALLEHVWWAYLASRGCTTGYMRMELGSNRELFLHRLRSGYCRRVGRGELGSRFLSACRRCELFGDPCSRQVYLAVDVEAALTGTAPASGPLDIGALPVPVELGSSFGDHRRVLLAEGAS